MKNKKAVKKTLKKKILKKDINGLKKRNLNSKKHIKSLVRITKRLQSILELKLTVKLKLMLMLRKLVLQDSVTDGQKRIKVFSLKH